MRRGRREGVLSIGLLFIYKASYILVPRVFPTRSSLGDVCPSRGWTCRPDKRGQSECRHSSLKVRQLTGPNTVLFRDDLYTDRLFGSGSIMPSCYALFPRTNDLQQKSSRKSSILFHEVLWLVVFSQPLVHYGQVVITCCYIGMIFTKNLFANHKCFFVKFFGSIVFSDAVVH